MEKDLIVLETKDSWIFIAKDKTGKFTKQHVQPKTTPGGLTNSYKDFQDLGFDISKLSFIHI